MNDVEYILRIILRARDEMARVLQNAQNRLRAFANESVQAQKKIDGLNSSITSLNRRIGNVVDKLDAWRTTIQGTSKEHDEAAKTLAQMGKETDRATESVRKNRQSAQDLIGAYQDLSISLRVLNEDFRSGKRDRDDAVWGYDRISKALDRLAKQARVGSSLSYDIRRAAQEAKDQARGIIEAERESQKERDRLRKESLRQREADAKQQAAIDKKAADDAIAQSRREAAEAEKAVDRKLQANAQSQQRRQREIDATNQAAERNRLKFLDDILRAVEDREAQSAKNSAQIAIADAGDRIRIEQNRQASLEQIRQKALDDAQRADREAERAEQEQARKRASFMSGVLSDVRKELNETDKLQAKAHQSSVDEDVRIEQDRWRRIAEESESGAKRTQQFIADVHKEIERQQAQVAKFDVMLGSADADDRVRIEVQRQQALEATRIASEKLTKAQADLERRGRETSESFRRFVSEVETGNITIEESRGVFNDYAARFRAISREYELGSYGARRFAKETENARTALRNAERDSARSGSFFQRLGREVNGLGDNVATLDNRLRGIGLLIVFAFAQQLISAFTGLGGTLVSVASSAAMAGAAIGGTLVAGIAQAIPMVGLLAAAMSRAGAVMEAFDQAQQLQQQRFVQGRRGGQQAADDTDRIANAQDSLTSATRTAANAQDQLVTANRRVIDAQRDLRAALQQGRRELEDVILAEKRAELAAKGAALSMEESREARRLATVGGSRFDLARAELDVPGARLDVQETGLARGRQRVDTRRAVRGGIEGTDAVRRARQQLDDAREGVEDARDAIEDADRGIDRAARGMERAERQGTETAAAMVTAQAQLDFLLSQLSPAERRLFDAVQDIRDTYKEMFRPVTDIIIDSFTRTVGRAEELLKMPSVIDAAKGTATEIATQMNRAIDAFTTPEMLDQLLRIIEQGRVNLVPITDGFIIFGEILANIAEAANPAFQQLIEYINDLLTNVLGLTEDSDKLEEFFLTGERHLEAWLNLGISIINLFAAISGAGGAEAGVGAVEDLTMWLNEMANSVRENKDDVGEFFEDARRATDAVISVVKELAIAIFDVFDADRVEAFARFINTVIIPAFESVVTTVGGITSAIATFLSLPGVSQLAKVGLMALILGQITSSTVGAVKYFLDIFKHVGSAITGIGRLTGIKTFANSLILPGSRLRGIASALGGIISRVPGLKRVGDAMSGWGGAPVVAGGPRPTPAGGGPVIVGGPGGPGRAGGPPVILGPDGRPLPPSSGPGRPTPDPRRGRAAARVGVTGLVAGAVATAAYDPGQIKLGEVQGANLMLQDLEQTVQALLSLDIGGFFGKFDATPIDEFRGFAGGAEESLETLLEDKNADGLRKLADRAREFQKEFPQAADALEALAESADKGAEHFENLEKLLKGVSDAGRRTVGRLGIDAEDILDPNAVSQLFSNFRRVRLAGVDSIGEMRKNMQFEMGLINKGFEQGSSGWFQAIGESMENSVEAIQDGMRRGKISQEDGMREIRRVTRTNMRLMRDNIDDLSVQAKDSLAGNFRAARLAIERQTGGWKKATGDALKEIRRLMAAELELYGLTPAQARRLARNRTTRGRENVGFQGGPEEGTRGPFGDAQGRWGFVGNKGERGKDSWEHTVSNRPVGRGEFVGNAYHASYIDPAMHAFYGHGLADMYQRFRGFHAGGFEQPGFARGTIVPIRGQGGNGTPPGIEYINSMIKRMVESLVRRHNALITDAYDPTGRKHKSRGHLETGTAVDFVPGPRGTWDQIEALGRWAVSKGHQVLYGDNGVGTPYENHGRGLHMHVEFGGGGAVGAVERAIRRLKRVDIGGPTSRLRDIGQTAVDNVRDAANRTLRRAIQRSGAMGDVSGDVQPMEADANVVSAFRRAIRTTGSGARSTSSLSLWMAGIVESALRNLPYGDADSEGALQLRTGIHGRNLARNPFASAVAFLTRGFFGRGGAIDLARNNPEQTAGWVAQQVQGSAFPSRYDQVAAQARRYLGMALGGMIPGYGGGDRHVRLLEGGEHVVTKEEVKAAGGHNFFFKLRKMLGGGTQGGPRAFQEGGEVSAAERKRVRRLTDVDLSDDAFRNYGAILSDIRDVFRRMVRVRRITDAIKPFFNLLDNLTGEGGFFDELRASIERRVTNAQRRITRAAFRMGPGGVVTRRTSELDEAESQLDVSRDIQRDLVGERRGIQNALRRVQRRQRRDDLTPAQERELQRQENDLRTRLNDAQQRVVDGLASIFEKQEAVVQARANAVQATVDDITKRFDAQSAGIDIARRLASAFGDTGWLARINKLQAQMLTDQANAVEIQATRARGIGATDLANQLQQQVTDLRTQIRELVQQQIRDAIEVVNNTAQRRMGRLDLFERMANAVGAVGLGAGITVGGETLTRAGALRQRGTVLRDQREDLTKLFFSARDQGNTGLANELLDQIAELEVAIAENTKAQFDARIEEVNAQTNLAVGNIDLQKRIIELQGEISGNTDQAALLNLTQQRQEALQKQRLALEQLLNEAIASKNTAAVNDLTTQLLQNQVALLENTQAMNDLNGTVSEPQGFTSSAWQWFNEAIFSGMGEVLPQYNPALNAAAGGSTSAGMAAAAVGRSSVFTRGIAPGSTPVILQQGDKVTNIEINEAGQPIDTTYLSSVIGFADKTEQ